MRAGVDARKRWVAGYQERLCTGCNMGFILDRKLSRGKCSTTFSHRLLCGVRLQTMVYCLVNGGAIRRHYAAIAHVGGGIITVVYILSVMLQMGMEIVLAQPSEDARGISSFRHLFTKRLHMESARFARVRFKTIETSVSLARG